MAHFVFRNTCRLRILYYTSGFVPRTFSMPDPSFQFY
jgi:hypothetical protein